MARASSRCPWPPDRAVPLSTWSVTAMTGHVRLWSRAAEDSGAGAGRVGGLLGLLGGGGGGVVGAFLVLADGWFGLQAALSGVPDVADDDLDDAADRDGQERAQDAGD